jgi:hypothetical protein
MKAEWKWGLSIYFTCICEVSGHCLATALSEIERPLSHGCPHRSDATAAFFTTTAATAAATAIVAVVAVVAAGGCFLLLFLLYSLHMVTCPRTATPFTFTPHTFTSRTR